MKTHLILKDFTGTHDGISPAEAFKAGEVRPVSDSLVAALGGTDGGYVKEAEAAARDIAKAPAKVAAAVLDAIDDSTVEDDASENPADDRETKVEAPEETKPAKKPKQKAS